MPQEVTGFSVKMLVYYHFEVYKAHHIVKVPINNAKAPQNNGKVTPSNAKITLCTTSLPINTT